MILLLVFLTNISMNTIGHHILWYHMIFYGLAPANQFDQILSRTIISRYITRSSLHITKLLPGPEWPGKQRIFKTHGYYPGILTKNSIFTCFRVFQIADFLQKCGQKLIIGTFFERFVIPSGMSFNFDCGMSFDLTVILLWVIFFTMSFD